MFAHGNEGSTFSTDAPGRPSQSFEEWRTHSRYPLIETPAQRPRSEAASPSWVTLEPTSQLNHSEWLAILLAVCQRRFGRS